MALVYGATPRTSRRCVAHRQQQVLRAAASRCLSIGAALLVVGFGFKVAVVPFHVWTPDVYEGAPTSVTAFMSRGRQGGRVRGVPPRLLRWRCRCWAKSCAGGRDPRRADDGGGELYRRRAAEHQADAGLLQHRARRLHAWSAWWRRSIREEANRRERSPAVLFYTLAYTVTNLGAFAVVHGVPAAARRCWSWTTTRAWG